MVKMAPSVHDGSIAEIEAAAIGEIWKAFSSVYASLAESQRKCLFLSELLFILINWQVFGCLEFYCPPLLSYFSRK
jgi:hypothetical protein